MNRSASTHPIRFNIKRIAIYTTMLNVLDLVTFFSDGFSG